MGNAGLVKRTIAVLRTVAARPDGIGLSEVARSSGIPKPTCHRILETLREERLVAFHPENKRYVIALELMSLVAPLLDERNVHLLVIRELEELSRETEETSGLDLLDERGVTVVLQVQGPRLISQAPRVPRQLPVDRSSTGKVLAAWLDPEELRQRFTDSLPRGADLDRFLDQLATVRKVGYAFAIDELEPGASAIAAPVFVGSEVIAAVWIGGPTSRIVTGQELKLAEHVVDAGRRLSGLFAAHGGWLLRDRASNSVAGRS